MRDDFNGFDPFEDMINMMRRFERQFNGSDKGLGFDKFKGNTREPLVDITENEKDVKVIIELPGLDKKDIDLRAKSNYLILKTQTSKSKDETNDNTVYKERISSHYSRTIPLPEYADTSKMSAKYNNGILEITIPKKKNAKMPKIEIK